MLPIESLNTGLADVKKSVSLLFLNFYLLIL